jgi:hypothetical protein
MATALETVMQTWAANPLPKYEIADTKPGSITMTTGQTEMIKVAPDGFYVRGQKVPVDDREAEMVYNAFKEFLVWNRLHRS